MPTLSCVAGGGRGGGKKGKKEQANKQHTFSTFGL